MQKVFKSDIAFSIYDNFIDDITADWYKIDFKKMASKVWESKQKIGIPHKLIGYFTGDDVVAELEKSPLFSALFYVQVGKALYHSPNLPSQWTQILFMGLQNWSP